MRMKRIIIIALVLQISSFSIAQHDTLVIRKLTEIEKLINRVTIPSQHRNDSIRVSLINSEKLTNRIEKSKSIWDDILPSLIAILVVLISTGGAIYLGIRQIKAQILNSEEQIRSQEAQAQDNLRVAREQIQETSNMTLAQVRANNISQARINWVQNLRNELSQFMGTVTLVNFYLQDVIDLAEKGNNIEAEKLYYDQTDRIKNARQYAFKIKLFLNREEEDHKSLEILIDNYYTSALENYSSVKSDFNTLSNEILSISRKILKDAWEQAKNEGKLVT